MKKLLTYSPKYDHLTAEEEELLNEDVALIEKAVSVSHKLNKKRISTRNASAETVERKTLGIHYHRANYNSKTGYFPVRKHRLREPFLQSFRKPRSAAAGRTDAENPPANL